MVGTMMATRLEPPGELAGDLPGDTPGDPPALTIARHWVAQGEGGLSPLQYALLHDPRPIRIAGAPTGAGKSYAFQRAMTDQGARVLFIVPTRRLAQNLAAGLVDSLSREPDWNRERAERRVAVWSSDQATALRAQGVARISGYRLRQMSALDLNNTGGEMIIAIPEVVSALLGRPFLDPGLSGQGVFDLLDGFDHIVFDEFHSIEARGFGLAGLFARLIAPSGEQPRSFGTARLSFLSATPLDLSPVLGRLGVPDEAIAQLREELTDEGRPLHGDVRLVLRDDASLFDTIEASGELIRAQREQGNKSIVIYNSLADLEQDLYRLARLFAGWGIEPSRVLVINSIRDSMDRGQHRCGFRVGRQQDPERFELILATASVEMGVTFRGANVMVMDPGFTPLNFLQRYGRAARGDQGGCVVACLPQAPRQRAPWLRELCSWVEQNRSRRCGVAELTEVLSRSTVREFDSHGDERFFGTLSKRALWCAGLYWQVYLQHRSHSKYRRQHLIEHSPPAARRVYALMRQVQALADDDEYRRPAKTWLALLRQQVLYLRDIGPRVTVIQGDGATLEIDGLWLRRETTILDRLSLDELDNSVRLSGQLDDYWREQRERDVQREWLAYFPHSAEVSTLTVGPGMVDAWLREFERIDPGGFAEMNHPQALDAARELVKLTGLVPGRDPDIPLDAISAIL